ncbi:MAG: substrate-binding domain-containing protein, partial [Oribacterium sp.]|nr:substrate-binding domain-containing protein [Oribacterium sp.]
MKKHLLTAVLMAASISLAGCNGNNPKPQPSGEAESSAQETEAESADGSENSGEASESTEGKEEKTETAEKKSEPIKLPDFDFTKENFPRLDGSTSTVPLGKTLTSALLGISEKEAEDLCVFNRTTQSFRNLLAGEADMLIVGEPNAKVFQEMADAGFKYRIEDFATDALIFVVNKDNPVDNLTTDQIRDIYSGKITNWKEVGGNDAEIKAFQRNEGAGSQALILKHIMKDTPMVTPPSSLVASEMGELMTAVKSYDNSANAIGYSVYYYANDMEKAKGLKIISVDGVKPEPATIREKKYPHRNAYYAVIPEETDP